MPTREAVLLLNLGSPDSPSVPDVKRYLREFLMDERVLDAPYLIRWLIVHGTILPKRPKKSAEAYASIWTDEGSPLIVISKRQQALLQEAAGIPVYLAMRYGSPSIPDVVRQMAADGVQRLFVMPMYPQYAMSSYETVVERTLECFRAVGFQPELKILQPFYADSDYIEALAETVMPRLPENLDRLLFSFHGIPLRHLERSDPSGSHRYQKERCCEVETPARATCYRYQCYASVDAFRKHTGLPAEKIQVSFQSRLGREPWLTPYTDRMLEQLPSQGVKNLAILCPAFVSDCLETLEEINMAGRESFLAAGGETFTFIPCMNDHPAWIRALANRIKDWQGSHQNHG
jgi:ferrochelatase